MSAGRTETPQQETFVNTIVQCLQDDGFDVVRALWSSEQPLKPIWRKMQECAGTAVIAFERLHFPSGMEFRGAVKEKPLEQIALPTIWNQIEAAMAYTLGHPLLVVVQQELRDEGLLEGRYDWYVQRVPLDPAVFSQREFRGVLSDWKERVLERERELASSRHDVRAAGPPVNLEAVTIGQLINSLKPAELWKLLGTLATLATAAFALGTFFGSR